MNHCSHSFSLLLTIAVAIPLSAADYRVEPLAEPAPQGEIEKEIHQQLNDQGVRIIRGSKTKFCDIWLCKDLAVQSDFKPTDEIQYPFTPGQLVGVVRYSRSGADFRDQKISKGVYTLRFALQPVDGAHVGTSLTRDFLLLVQATVDQKAKPLGYDSLVEASSEAAASTHPCMLSLQKTAGAPGDSRIRHNDQHDWWIVSLDGKTKDQPLPIDLVVVGLGAE
jgi:hypothetical protein